MTDFIAYFDHQNTTIWRCLKPLKHIISGTKKITCGLLLISLDIENECIMASLYFSDL